MSNFFYNLGRQIGRKAVPALRKTKHLWEAVAGSDDESVQAECALGRDMAAEFRATVEPVSPSDAGLDLDEVCGRLASRLRDQRRSFSCEVFRDPCPHAIALPGGYLFLSDSLASFCGWRTEELAFVLGHEMAHVMRRDAVDKLLSEAAFKVASTATARMGLLGGVVRAQGLNWLRNAYSRDRELAADEFGFRLAAAAGYPHEGARGFLERLGALSAEETTAAGPYFGMHPPARVRAAHLEVVRAAAERRRATGP